MTLKSQAIQTALTGDWSTACELNRKLLEENPDDIETLNRLAFAYTVLGNLKEAKNTYQTVLKYDKENPIALKNLRRLSDANKYVIKGEKGKASGRLKSSPLFTGQINSIFIEESGKTKVVELINITDSKIISELMIGELLALNIKRLKIFILNEKKQYVGMLPDDIGKRLIKFIKGGNHYEAYIKSVENNRVTIFIKETSKTSRFKNQASFPCGEKNKTIITSKNYSALRDLEDSEASDNQD
ncbi:MAG: tetratricopeptide repeat protein [Candidatus Levybacteria bacterium]|nr:tetratricopeptide repeat protein [Candidatus Levybacteria bacterium]